MFKSILVIIGLILIIPLFMPSSYEIQRSIVIENTQETIYSSLVNLDYWKHWSPWREKEPNAEYIFKGIPGVVGSSLFWKGEQIGSGIQTLTVLNAPEYIETSLTITEPQVSEAVSFIQIEEVTEERSKVIWGIRGDLSYPIGRVMGLFIESEIAPDFERGLIKLKSWIEQKEPQAS